MYFVFGKTLETVALIIEETKIVYAQCDRLASHDVIKHHVIISDIIIKVAFQDKEKSALLRRSLSRSISRLPYFNLKAITFL